MLLRLAKTTGKVVSAMAMIVKDMIIFFDVGTDAHCIMKIIAKHLKFSTFNHYPTRPTLIHYVDEDHCKAPKVFNFNQYPTGHYVEETIIIVYAVENSTLNGIRSKHLSIRPIKNILSIQQKRMEGIFARTLMAHEMRVRASTGVLTQGRQMCSTAILLHVNILSWSTTM